MAFHFDNLFPKLLVRFVYGLKFCLHLIKSILIIHTQLELILIFHLLDKKSLSFYARLPGMTDIFTLRKILGLSWCMCP